MTAKGVPLPDALEPSTIVCDVSALVDADVATVDALARLQLAARRHGCRVVLRQASRDLQELLAFVGLGDVMPCEARLRVEPRRQTEEREQARGVEERRELDDPSV